MTEVPKGEFILFVFLHVGAHKHRRQYESNSTANVGKTKIS